MEPIYAISKSCLDIRDNPDLYPLMRKDIARIRCLLDRLFEEKNEKSKSLYMGGSILLTDRK
jgi:hypothetical protein